MPAKSQAQQKAAGAALSAKRGETKKSELKGASKSMEKSMSEKELKELAETDRKNLPKKKK
ncbi:MULTISPECIES: DUF3008 family protein [Rhizobium/Agrobacterium group]|jgi:hypothetical protein|uniref:DUF3008 family protein n=1 Tax=Rhizobium/Agrobacterium group TaxID=227290 RepID=UPI0007147D8E|nr:DUF3008 family protein [Rhizobium sp. Root483D2]KQY33930.1 hypothetical protein ASD32_21955 [Rhizobium sp. Root483D2]